MDIFETAELWGLDTATSGNKSIIIGFQSFDQAQYLADKFGGRVREYRKRDGHFGSWEDFGIAVSAFDLEHKDWGDNFRVLTDDDLDDFYKNEVLPHLGDFDDTGDVLEYVEGMRRLELSVLNKSDEQCILAENVNGHYEFHSIQECRAMRYHFDVTSYVIGVEVPEE